MTIYSPPRRAPRGTRLIFLIGPIQGAADWQGDAATIIGKKAPGIVIASPRSGMWEPGLAKSEKARLFNIQREWEWDHIELAIEEGCALVYLDQEAEYIPGRSFAQTSRIEFSLILGWLTGGKGSPFRPFKGQGVTAPPVRRIVFGAHPKFSGRRYLADLLESHRFVLHGTLDATCEAAIKMYSRR